MTENEKEIAATKVAISKLQQKLSTLESQKDNEKPKPSEEEIKDFARRVVS